MANDRLRAALKAAGLSVQRVAERLDVDPKTVERWVTQGRMPYPRHRQHLAALLDEDPAELWPEPIAELPSNGGTAPTLVEAYTQLAHMPAELWHGLFDGASRRIDILSAGGPWWIDQMPQLVHGLMSRALQGVPVRLLMADPTERALAVLDPFRYLDRIDIRVHDCSAPASIYQLDNDMIVNPRVYGLADALAPALHVRRHGPGDLFETYLMSFERVWQNAEPSSAAIPEADASVRDG